MKYSLELLVKTSIASSIAKYLFIDITLFIHHSLQSSLFITHNSLVLSDNLCLDVPIPKNYYEYKRFFRYEKIRENKASQLEISIVLFEDEMLEVKNLELQIIKPYLCVYFK